jgi:uncharacterized membrane protein
MLTIEKGKQLFAKKLKELTFQLIFLLSFLNIRFYYSTVFYLKKKYNENENYMRNVPIRFTSTSGSQKGILIISHDRFQTCEQMETCNME